MAPLSATITGSTTIGASPTRSSASTTASIVASSPSIPILTASTPMSSATARTWATIVSGGTGVTSSTPTVFCAVSAVIAVVPCTPQRAKALRSAWIPAPPPESEPAIERQAGTRATLRHGVQPSQRACARLVRRVGAGRVGDHVAEQLQPGEGDRGVVGRDPGRDRDGVGSRAAALDPIEDPVQLRLERRAPA